MAVVAVVALFGEPSGLVVALVLLAIAAGAAWQRSEGLRSSRGGPVRPEGPGWKSSWPSRRGFLNIRRVIAGIVMLARIAFLAAITASIPATSVERARPGGLQPASSAGKPSHGDS
jgi:hypothetical protein